MAKGRRGTCGCLHFCCLSVPASPESPAEARVLVSVPKRYFKRAVRRNLLKRRIREAYRLQKALLLDDDCQLRRYDILFSYASPEISSSEEIRKAVATILKEIRSWEH